MLDKTSKSVYGAKSKMVDWTARTRFHSQIKCTYLIKYTYLIQCTYLIRYRYHLLDMCVSIGHTRGVDAHAEVDDWLLNQS